MRFVPALMLNSAWRIVAPLREKIVRPLKSMMSSRLTPLAISAGCFLGAMFWRSRPSACRSVPTSFQPMLRSFMISMTLTGLAFDAFAARSAATSSVAVVTLR